ncbi:MAG: 4-alpha-glucanotransferase [Treponema sp.]|jgi:4-alpha-glucanotransferase|nr:4-alpha-glucanotransferase [Treponema sp.]
MANAEKKRDPDKRLTGVVVPVGALRGKGSLGVGEFPDLADFAVLCKKMGLGLIQILPVNDSGYESAPYWSLTAFALHPVYLRIEDLEEFKHPLPGLREKIAGYGAQFDKETRFPFQRICRAKMEILREIYDVHKGDIAKKAAAGGLAQWIGKNPWVKEYAVYRRFKELNGERSWKQWDNHRQVTAATIETLWQDEKLRGGHLFWAWLQEALDTQFRRAARAVADLGLILMGDIPILMNDDSVDVWAHPEYFHLDLSAGAPPDMYSPGGQNWGFPVYNWQALAGDNYEWWQNRLAAAGKHYGAYRIDHVLGFFRIWASSIRDLSGSSMMGRFIPYAPVTQKDLKDLGFDKGRVRWVSRPHVPTGEVWEYIRNNWGGDHSEDDVAAEAGRVFSAALDRIGDEELWLFKDTIGGEKDIDALGLHPAARDYLIEAWHNRIFLEYEKGHFSPLWFYRDSRAYASLSDGEKRQLETLLEKRKAESEKVWEEQGKKLLMALCASSSMLPCAEDLGAVPDCVPRVLGALKILGLRVVRWFRDWDREDQPYVALEDYPELTICTPAVHDSSTVREWWEREANQEQFSGFIGVPSLPRVYNPGTAKVILSKIASARSRFRVFQIQDLLHLSNRWYAPDPASERINVPGTYNEFNWTYRLPAPIEEIGQDADFIKAVEELCQVKPVEPAPKKK